MSLLSKLFGRKPEQVEPVKYEGFQIFPEPINEGSEYRISARIEKEIGGEMKVHQLIRADTLGDADEAAEASLGKARTLIDQQGERLFD